MLNQTTVLEYIKDNLGWPFMFLELEDQKIIDYFTAHTRRTFSHYHPQKQTMGLNTSVASLKVPGKANEWYLNEPDGLEILNVVDMYTTAGDLYIFGHPPLGVFSHFELREWALQTEQAMATKMFSTYDYTFEFKHPNILRISPYNASSGLGVITVEYERMQPEDLSGIPNDLQQYFKDLALADILLVIGRIRKRYGGGNLRTPFGEIPLEADVYEEGKELKRETIEILERLFIPNVKIDHG
jgi:hypothetical protein